MASAGFEPANLGTKGQHTTSRPPKPPTRVLLFYHIFTRRINNTIYVSTHKHLISFQNCFRFYLRFAMARVERCFLISNVSLGNIMLSGEEYVFCKPQVEWAHHNIGAWGWGKGNQTCHCTSYHIFPASQNCRSLDHAAYPICRSPTASQHPLCNYMTFLFRSFMLMN